MWILWDIFTRNFLQLPITSSFSDPNISYVHCSKRSRNSSVGIATGYGLDGRGSFPSRDKSFLVSIAASRELYPLVWSGMGMQLTTHPSSDNVKKNGAIPPLLHVFSLHSASLIKLRNNFTLPCSKLSLISHILNTNQRPSCIYIENNT
jgi:hypothetical protein